MGVAPLTTLVYFHDGGSTIMMAWHQGGGMAQESQKHQMSKSVARVSKTQKEQPRQPVRELMEIFTKAYAPALKELEKH